MIRNLIWDLDGTLFDTYPAIIQAFADVCTERGKPVSLARIRELVIQSLDHCIETLAAELGITPKAVEERFGEYHKAVLPAQQMPFPGVIRICEHIHSGGGLNVVITHRGRSSTEELLRVHKMMPYFTNVLSHEDGYPRKPDPAAFVAMMNKHHFTREDTLAIGDRDIDTLAAQGAGLRACLFGIPSSQVIPDMAITDYAELLKMLT